MKFRDVDVHNVIIAGYIFRIQCISIVLTMDVLLCYIVCMSSVLLSIKTDPDTKAELQSFAKELGVSSTALVNMVIKQTLRDRSVKLEAPLTPTPYLQKIMKKAEGEITRGETYGPFDSIDDIFTALESGDNED